MLSEVLSQALSETLKSEKSEKNSMLSASISRPIAGGDPIRHLGNLPAYLTTRSFSVGRGEKGRPGSIGELCVLPRVRLAFVVAMDPPS